MSITFLFEAKDKMDSTSLSSSPSMIHYITRINERLAALEKSVSQVPLQSVQDLQFVINVIKEERARCPVLREMLKCAPTDRSRNVVHDTIDVSGDGSGDLLDCDKFFLYQIAVTLCNSRLHQAMCLQHDMQRDIEKTTATNKRLRDERDTALSEKNKRPQVIDLSDYKVKARETLFNIRKDFNIPDGDPLGRRLLSFTRDLLRDIEDDLNGVVNKNK